MPNLYVTPTEIKAAAPDAIQTSTTKYDSLLLRLANRISRFIDGRCHREFFPRQATRYFDGQGKKELKVKDLLSITTIYYSLDDGETYTALAAADYYATVEGDYNSTKSYTELIVSALSDTLSVWPTGQRSVKIEGVWGYADDRDAAFEDSTDDVEDNPLSDSATSITVNDFDGADLWGVAPRFQPGQIARIESELVEITAAANDILTVVRARNGSTAAAHVQDTNIELWRPPEPVKQAAIITAVRQMERGFQGFGEARANVDTGQMFWVKSLDPEAKELLQDYIW